MNTTIESTQVNSTALEVIGPDEFIRRLGIAMSTLHSWKSKEWLVERRHFLKIGKKVRYFWSNELLNELHDNSHRTSVHDKKQPQPQPTQATLGKAPRRNMVHRCSVSITSIAFGHALLLSLVPKSLCHIYGRSSDIIM